MLATLINIKKIILYIFLIDKIKDFHFEIMFGFKKTS